MPYRSVLVGAGLEYQHIKIKIIQWEAVIKGPFTLAFNLLMTAQTS